MEYNVFSKKRDSTISNADLRSGTGDMHAHRNALLMKSHVEMLLEHDMLNSVMAVNLSKPLDREWKYTEAYLKTHPEYTGVQPKMSTLSTAEKHQKMRDKEMERFVRDYEEGRIDAEGKPIRAALEPIDTNSGDESSSPSPSREPKPPTTTPHQPLPGYPDYAQYKYYTLLAICRERRIRSPGGTQEVRNLLIRDDINVARGLPQDVAVWKRGNGEVYKHGADRKVYKHYVPDGMRGKGKGKGRK
ncbi:hypothetical protein B5807_03276 [Epicoccum nigrum]|uniref:Uncharacterized protein n=1 Tax=Epicoccum nigrum TaxID=105696 RepID=A0A1Y2M7M7_EPING|nr:hypothetical protein B5807_03276 [Epicoccum nigrum]